MPTRSDSRSLAFRPQASEAAGKEWGVDLPGWRWLWSGKREGKGKKARLQPVSGASWVSGAAAEGPQPEGKTLRCHSPATRGGGSCHGEDLLPDAAFSRAATRSRTRSAMKVRSGKTAKLCWGHGESSQEKPELELQETARTKIRII